MKRFLVVLFALWGLAASSFAQSPALYIYFKDGNIDAIPRSEVDSMTCSHYDIDSVCHANWQMQVIHTSDSTYRIPLTELDSISLVAPPHEYKKDVMLLSDEWADYVVSYTDSTILFIPETPQRILPEIGQVLAIEAGSATFPDGFAGRMAGKEIIDKNIQANFTPVQLQDVYSKLIAVGSAESYNSDGEYKNSLRRVYKNEKDVNIILPHELGFEVSTDNASLSGTFMDPSLQIDYFICIWEANLKDYVKFKYRFDSDGKITTSLKKDLREPIEKIKWSQPFFFAPFGVPCSLRVGGFIELGGTIELNSEFPFHLNSHGGFEYDENLGTFTNMRALPGGKTDFKWKEPEWALSLNGSVYAGGAVELAVGLAYKKVKVAQGDITIKSGLELSSNFTVASNEGINTSAYDFLKNTQVDLALKTNVTFGYNVFLCSKRHELPFSISMVHLKRSTRLVPEVSDLSWKYLGTSKGTLNGDVSYDTFMPCQLGWALYDDGNRLVRKDYFPEKYWLSDKWPYNGLQYIYTNLPSSFSYKAYPLIKLWKMEIRVPESVDMSSNISAHVTKVNQTGSKYSKDEFYNEGYSYDYKYDVATTVEIESLEGVADWGYVYKDPYGNIKHISLMGYGTSYTDTRYAYYRNEPKSTVCFYGYVKYKGDDKYYYADAHDYPLEYIPSYLTCPDDHHPHAIDLGLPSGTKWACCNVGASSPEQYGGYYAWGETSEKSVYNWDTYQYGSSEDNCQNIGSDIAGTSYDVAHVRMGAPWRMPSLAQQEELNNCTRTWTQQNGINGILVTGKNGGQLFLPAAGDHYDGGLSAAGSGGRYWSSSLIQDRDCFAYRISFGSDYWMWWSGRLRLNGYSVRAVCP